MLAEKWYDQIVVCLAVSYAMRPTPTKAPCCPPGARAPFLLISCTTLVQCPTALGLDGSNVIEVEIQFKDVDAGFSEEA
jgi:hypothetical protein